MRIKLAAAAIAAALSAGAASAADVNGQFFIMGEPGMMPCQTLIARQNDHQTGVALGLWIAGYTTALNRFLPNTFSLFNGNDLGPFIADVVVTCQANPNALVEEVVHAALDKRAATRVVQRP